MVRKQALSPKLILIVGIAAAVLINGGVFTWIASSSRSWGAGAQFAVVFLPIVAIALLPGLVGIGIAFSRRTRLKGLALIVSSVLAVVPFPYAMRAGQHVRMSGFDDFVERSKPLVSAIRAYEQKRGEPPAALRDLVPEFLPAVPETGIGPSPTYEYIHGETAQSRFGERWMLLVGCSSGLLNWDRILYYESEDYPAAFGNSAWLERIGDWAYEHE